MYLNEVRVIRSAAAVIARAAFVAVSGVCSANMPTIPAALLHKYVTKDQDARYSEATSTPTPTGLRFRASPQLKALLLLNQSGSQILASRPRMAVGFRVCLANRLGCDLLLLMLLLLCRAMLSYPKSHGQQDVCRKLRFKLMRLARTCLANSAGKIFLRTPLQQKP
eukprot:4204-Heterococcus_DN1.PRE.1